MSKTRCTKCEAADARATECLGMLNVAQGRIADLTLALVQIEQVAADRMGWSAEEAIRLIIEKAKAVLHE